MENPLASLTRLMLELMSLSSILGTRLELELGKISVIEKVTQSHTSTIGKDYNGTESVT